MHTLVEKYLYNEELPQVQPLSDILFKLAKPELAKIDNIHSLEGSMYSKQLGIAGTVDCIAEYNGELAIIDFKTSKKPNQGNGLTIILFSAVLMVVCVFELTGIVVKKFVILMSCENGECVVYEEYDKSKYIKLLDRIY